MKLLSILAVSAAAVLLPELLQAQTDYAVTARGLNYSVYQKTNAINGTNQVLRYTELASGLNYTNSSGQLVPSVESIEPLSGG